MPSVNGERTRIVYVIGHRNPDTDSICSAIGYAHFKNLTDKRYLFTPARAGRITEKSFSMRASIPKTKQQQNS